MTIPLHASYQPSNGHSIDEGSAKHVAG